MKSLAQLTQLVGQGDLAARDELYSAACSELRELTGSRSRDGGRNSRNTFLETARVSASYMYFIGSGQLRVEFRSFFFAYTSRVMKLVTDDSGSERRTEWQEGNRGNLTAIAFSRALGQAHVASKRRAILKHPVALDSLLHRIMDWVYEGNAIRQLAQDLGFIPIDPPLKTQVEPLEYDREMYGMCSANIASVAPPGSRLARTEERGTMRSW